MSLTGFPITFLRIFSIFKIIPPAGNRIVIEFSDFKLEHATLGQYSDYEDEYDYSDVVEDKSQDEESKCSYDILTIEENESGGSSIQSKKYCDTMPKKMNTTNVVTLM